MSYFVSISGLVWKVAQEEIGERRMVQVLRSALETGTASFRTVASAYVAPGLP